MTTKWQLLPFVFKSDIFSFYVFLKHVLYMLNDRLHCRLCFNQHTALSNSARHLVDLFYRSIVSAVTLSSTLTRGSERGPGPFIVRCVGRKLLMIDV